MLKSKRTQLFWLSLIILVASTYLLVTGSPVLMWNMKGKLPIPFGNITTWLGFIALNTTIRTGLSSIYSPIKRVHIGLSKVLNLALVIAVFWIPIGYLLSGNLSNSFGTGTGFQGSQTSMRIFWGVNYGLVLVPLIILTAYWIYKIIEKKKKGEQQTN